MKKQILALVASSTVAIGFSVTPVFADAPAGAPSAPQSVGVSVNGPTATISWKAPADSGSSPITGYTGIVAYGNQQQLTCQTTKLSCSVNIAALGFGSTVIGRAIATNAAGDSETAQAPQAMMSGYRTIFPDTSGTLSLSQKVILKAWLKNFCPNTTCYPPIFAFTITGYTDKSATGATATQQCRARANAVVAYLNSIVPAGAGANKPTFNVAVGGATNQWDKSNPVGNRRVTLMFRPNLG